jgi:putative membrane protein
MTDPTPVLMSLMSGLPLLLLHLATATAVWLAALVAYLWITPHKELALIRGGNVAAAISLGGAAMGLAIPMAFTLAGSVNVWDIAIWGAMSLLLQLIAFRAADFILKDLPQRIERGELAAAIFVAMTKLALAALNAAAITG